MAIIAPQTAENYAVGEYHRINKIELICSCSEEDPHYLVYVGFYAHQIARDNNPRNPLYTNVVRIPVNQLTVDPRVEMYDLLMNTSLFAGTNATSDVATQGAQNA